MPNMLARRLPPRIPLLRLTSTRVGTPQLVDQYVDELFPFVRVQIAPGADIEADSTTWGWQDVSNVVRASERITVKRGRSDVSSQPEPSRITFTVNNPTGDWTPDFPTGAHYPYMDVSLPVRVFVNYGSGDVLLGTCFVEQLAVDWDTSLNLCVTTVTASGLLRRYGQGSRAAQSLIKTYTLAALNASDVASSPPVGYWPLEDPSGSETFAEVMGTQQPMKWNETEPSFASDGPPGSKNVVKLATATELYADIVPFVCTATDGWTLRFLVNIPAGITGTIPVVIINSLGTIVDWRICIAVTGGTDDIVMQGFNAAGTMVVNSSVDFADSTALQWVEGYDKWLTFQFTAYQSGSDIAWGLTCSESVTAASQFNSGTIAGTWNIPTRIGVHNFWNHANWLYGHFVLYADDLGVNADIPGGLAGQNAAERMMSAALYEREPTVEIVGTDSDTEEMGTWTVATYQDTLFECEKVDGGILYDARTPNLEYRTRTSRYNQTSALTLDMSAGQISPQFLPERNDSRLRNEWTVSRSGGNSSAGSSATVTDDDSVDTSGRYPDSTSINISGDDLLVHHAGWRVNLGTTPGMRLPRIMLDLVKNADLASTWASLALGDRMTLTGLPTQLPPEDVDLVLEGDLITIGPGVCRVDMNCSPYYPWDVFIVGHAIQGRAGAGTSVLAASVTSGATSLSVASANAADLWTTTATFAADFPFDIVVGGEVMTVTAITGASTPQTFTVTRSINGVVKSHQYNTSVTLWHGAPLAL